MTKKEQEIADKLKIIKEIKSQDLSPSAKEAFEFLRKKAKEEDKAEYEGKENVSIKGREALRDSIIALYNLGYDGIEETDTKIISDSFSLHPKLANKEIIKFIVLGSIKKNGLNFASKMVDKLMESLEETKYYKSLVGYKDWIRKKSYLPQIKVLKAQGMHNAQIGERLGISSAEVLILLEKDKKDIEEPNDFVQ